MSTLSSVIITPHEYYMILPVMGVSAASVYYLALALHINATTGSLSLEWQAVCNKNH